MSDSKERVDKLANDIYHFHKDRMTKEMVAASSELERVLEENLLCPDWDYGKRSKLLSRFLPKLEKLTKKKEEAAASIDKKSQEE